MRGRDSKNLAINPAFFQEIKEDRQELQSIIKQLKTLTSNPAVLYANESEFRKHLAQFRDQLAFHFAIEEAYGYFDEALEVAPQLNRQSQRLRAQHIEIYERAQQLAETAALGRPHDLDQLSKHAITLIAVLEVHEAAETQMIMSAMNDDFGGGD